MGANTKIEWCDHTVNFWFGCTKTSPACDFCYAETWAKRSGIVRWGHGKARRQSVSAVTAALKLDKAAAAAGRRDTVFSNSLSDVFDHEVPAAFRDEMFATIAVTPNLEWLLLTKRHALARRYLPQVVMPNVRIGMTVESEEWARMRLPRLVRLALDGWKTFVSYEPALGPVDWWPWLDPEGLSGGCIQWIIAGGESGPRARYTDAVWFRSTRDACRRAGVPFFQKQMTKKAPIPGDLMVREFPAALRHAQPPPSGR